MGKFTRTCCHGREYGCSLPLAYLSSAYHVWQNETSCRTAIDLILLTATKLAQQQIKQNKVIEDTIRARHSVPSDDDDSGWVVLHQEVVIPDQALSGNVYFHGILDHLIGIVSAKRGASNITY